MEVDEKEGCELDVVAYTTLMGVLCRAGRLNKARKLLKEMKNSQYRPDYVTYNTLIDKYGGSGNVDAAWEVWKEMEADRCGPNVVTFTSIINALCYGGKVDVALGLLAVMIKEVTLPTRSLIIL